MSIHYYVPALFFMIVIGICKTTNPVQNDIEKDERALMFGKQVKDLLISIILNGWNFGDVSIPRLDPLQIEGSIDAIDTPGLTLIKHASLANTNITGLSKFVSNELGIALNASTSTAMIVFDLTLNVEGGADYVELDIVIGENIPVYGNGTLSLNASLDVSGAIIANIDPFITLTGINLDLSFASLNVHISNLMGRGETRQSQIFNDLIGKVTPPTVSLMAPSIVNAFVGTINMELEKLQITYNDMVTCMISPSNCQFPMPGSTTTTTTAASLLTKD